MQRPPQPVIDELVRALPTGAVHLAEVQEAPRLRMEITLLAMEVELLHERMAAIAPAKLPPWSPILRPKVLRLMRLRGESTAKFARRIRLSESTILRWKRMERAGIGGSAVAYNRFSDAVRGAVHEVKRLLPELNIGTRMLTHHLRRRGIQLSRSTFQRILREPPPKPKPMAMLENPPMAKSAPAVPHKVEPYGPLRPVAKNEVWHLDLTTKRIFWVSFTIAALVDGKTRKCLAMDLFAAVPGSEALLAMMEAIIGRFGKPATVITDRGGQFQTEFREGLTKMEIAHVQGKPQRPQFNGKIERLFRTLTFALIKRLIWFPYDYAGLQSVLDDWRDWYNTERPHQALDGRTPDEAWRGVNLQPAVTYRARDKLQPKITLSRHDHRELACCPVLSAEVEIAA